MGFVGHPLFFGGSLTWNQAKQTTYKLVESNVAMDILQPNSSLMLKFRCEPPCLRTPVLKGDNEKYASRESSEASSS